MIYLGQVTKIVEGGGPVGFGGTTQRRYRGTDRERDREREGQNINYYMGTRLSVYFYFGRRSVNCLSYIMLYKTIV